MNDEFDDDIIELISFSEDMKEEIINTLEEASSDLSTPAEKVAYPLYALAATVSALIFELEQKGEFISQEWFFKLIEEKNKFLKKSWGFFRKIPNHSLKKTL